MKKILILSANPVNTKKLRLDEEVREIESALERSRHREEFELIPRLAVRIDDLRRALLDHSPQVVHFSGHGDGTDGIALEDNSGNAQLVSTESLSNLFKLFKDTVECVLLNACYSETQAEAIYQHINCVIGMKHTITDKAAILFSKAFYDTLGAGRSYEEAFNFGCNNINLNSIPESLTPKLHIRNKSKTLSYNYVKRQCVEEDNFRDVILNNYLIRVKGPALTGKTLFLNHVLQVLLKTQNEFQILHLYLTKSSWENVDDERKFLKWFCEEIARQLSISSYCSWQQDEENITPLVKCTNDFEKYFLQLQNSKFLIIYFKNFNEIFNKPKILKFFPDLLRSWENKVTPGHRGWQRLRLILEYSTDSYVTNSLDSSPFWNTGYVISLKDFNRKEVQYLLDKFKLKWSDDHLNQFMDIVNGHPYLVDKALEHLSKDRTYKIDHYLKDPARLEKIYWDYLKDIWGKIQQNSKLQEVFKKIILASDPIKVGDQEAFELFSMGLILIDGDTVMPRCNLYRQYFRKRFHDLINPRSIKGEPNMNKASYYKVGGPLSVSNDMSYVTREADRKIIELLKNGDYCYVFNCHQMGKSSLQAHTSAKLQTDGFACILTDLQGIGKGDKKQWYNSLISSLTKVNTTDKSNLLEGFDLDNWLNEQRQKERTPEDLLSAFIKEVLLHRIPQEQKLVIFIDEIGELIDLDFSDNFLALIRSFYTSRGNEEKFKRLAFVLLGVTKPQKLVKNINLVTLNIGKTVDLQGFKQEEAIKGLAKGLQGKAEDCEKVIEAILSWTGGQPFLTQKLCKMVESSSDYIKKGEEELIIKRLVESDIIEKWEDKDEPAHLKTIKSKVLFPDERLENRLRLYKKILDNEKKQNTDSIDVKKISDKDENQNADNIVKLELQLSGLVIEKEQKLKVYNRIYKEIFKKEWVEDELAKIQPDFYIKKFKQWIDKKKDKKYLLDDKELIEVQEYIKGKNLSDEENEFLNQSRIEQVKKRIIQTSILIGVLIVVFIVTAGIGISISRENNQKQKAQQQFIELQQKSLEDQKKAQQQFIELQQKSIEDQKKAQQQLTEFQQKAQQESVQLIWKFVLGISIILVIGLVLIIGFIGR